MNTKVMVLLVVCVFGFFPLAAKAGFGEGNFQFSYFGVQASINCTNTEGTWIPTYYPDGKLKTLYTIDDDSIPNPCKKSGLSLDKAKGAWRIKVIYPNVISFDTQGNVESIISPLPFIHKFSYEVNFDGKRAYDTNMMDGKFTFWPDGSLKAIITTDGTWLGDENYPDPNAIFFTRIEFSQDGSVTKVVPCDHDADSRYCKNWNE